jgi:membrane-associated protein
VLVVLASLAAIIGDNVGFAIGRRYGRRIFERPGVAYDQRLALLDLGEPFFAKHGPKAVFLGRWVSGLRIASAWLAGINGMSWPVFLVWNALGGILWACVVGFGVYLLGDVAEKILTVAGPVAAALFVVLVIGVLVLRHRRRSHST